MQINTLEKENTIMIDNTSKISLTYSLGGEYLRTRGVYTTAKLSKEANESYTKTDGDVIKIKSIIEPSKTEKSPLFSTPTQHITLGQSFIEEAMERPKKPHKKASIHEWNLYHNWHKMSNTVKLNVTVRKYVSDLGGGEFEWELI